MFMQLIALLEMLNAYQKFKIWKKKFEFFFGVLDICFQSLKFSPIVYVSTAAVPAAFVTLFHNYHRL